MSNDTLEHTDATGTMDKEPAVRPNPVPSASTTTTSRVDNTSAFANRLKLAQALDGFFGALLPERIEAYVHGTLNSEEAYEEVEVLLDEDEIAQLTVKDLLRDMNETQGEYARLTRAYQYLVSKQIIDEAEWMGNTPNRLSIKNEDNIYSTSTSSTTERVVLAPAEERRPDLAPIFQWSVDDRERLRHYETTGIELDTVQ